MLNSQNLKLTTLSFALAQIVTPAQAGVGSLRPCATHLHRTKNKVRQVNSPTPAYAGVTIGVSLTLW